MRTDDAASLRFLAEWHTPRARGRAITDVAHCLRESTGAMPAAAHPPELLYALEVPQDAYAFGVFAAESAEAVAQVCLLAGIPADRISAAVEAPSPR
jgi:hypothetical protein